MTQVFEFSNYFNTGNPIDINTVERLLASYKNDDIFKQKLIKLQAAMQQNNLKKVKVASKDHDFVNFLNQNITEHITGLNFAFDYSDDIKLSEGLNKPINDDIYDEINKIIIDEIKKSNGRWRKTWHTSGYRIAYNFITKKPYKGFYNQMILGRLLFGKPLSNPYYLTQKQIDKLGGKLKRNAKPQPAYYYNVLYRIKNDNLGLDFKTYDRKKMFEYISKNAGKLNLKSDKIDRYISTHCTVPYLKSYIVYNGEHITGIDFKLDEFKGVGFIDGSREYEKNEKIPIAEKIIKNYPKPAPKIKRKEQDRAFYNPADDSVTMPLMKQFESSPEYYGTLFHELIHSTGHPKRLKRDFSGKFGSKNYAFEELIAEIGASYLSALSGILHHNIKNTAAYLRSWKKTLVKHLEDDNQFIMKAAAKSRQATDYITKDLVIEPEKPAKKQKQPKQTSKPKIDSKNETINKIHSLIKEELKENDFTIPAKRKYRLGDKWREDFDYKGMLEYGLKITDKTPATTIKKLYNSFVDVNYHTIANELWNRLVELESQLGEINQSEIDDKNKIKGAYYVLNSDNKLELHFENVSDYKDLPDEIKKDIKSSFIWGRKRKAWVSRSKGGNVPFGMRKYKIDYKGSNELNDFETQLSSKTENAKKRAERFEGYANNAIKRAENLQAEFNKYRKDWSWLTQPITPGSGGRAFARHKKKVMDKYERGFEEYKKSDYYKERAIASLKTAEQLKLKSIPYLEDKIKKLTKEIAKREEVLSNVDLEKLKKDTKLQIWYDAYLNSYKLATQALPFYKAKLEEEREKNKGQIDPWAKINKKEFANFLKDKYGLNLLTLRSQKYANDRMYYFKTDKDLPQELHSGWAAGNAAQKYSKYLQELMNEYKEQNQKGLNQPYRKVSNLFKDTSNKEMFNKIKKFLYSISGKKYFNKDLNAYVLVNKHARKKILFGGERIDKYKATAIMHLPELITMGKVVNISEPKDEHIKRYKAEKVYNLKSHIKIGRAERDYILTIFETDKGMLKYYIQEDIKKVAGTNNGKAQKEQSATQQLSYRKDKKKKKTSQKKITKTTLTENKFKKRENKVAGLTPVAMEKEVEFVKFPMDEKDPLSLFLGDLEKKPKGSIVITNDAPQGAGKTRFLFQQADLFARSGNKVLFLSLEEHKDSKLFRDKIKQYISDEGKENFYVASELPNGKNDFYKYAKEFDVILIDSWNKLFRIIKEKNDHRLNLDYDIRNKFDGKIFSIIYQRTQGGKMRGGAEAQFDGDVILKINKTDDFKQNYVYYDKNRYVIDDFKWNIFYKKLVGEKGMDEPEITNESLYSIFKKKHPKAYIINGDFQGETENYESGKIFWDLKEAKKEFEDVDETDFGYDKNEITDDDVILLEAIDYEIDLSKLPNIFKNYKEFEDYILLNFAYIDDFDEYEVVDNIDAKDLKNINSGVQEHIYKVLNELSSKTGVTFDKYTNLCIENGKILPLSKGSNRCKEIKVRIADHTHNIKNGSPDLKVVITNYDPTRSKFKFSDTDLVFTTKDSVEKIVNEIIGFIQEEFS